MWSGSLPIAHASYKETKIISVIFCDILGWCDVLEHIVKLMKRAWWLTASMISLDDGRCSFSHRNLRFSLVMQPLRSTLIPRNMWSFLLLAVIAIFFICPIISPTSCANSPGLQSQKIRLLVVETSIENFSNFMLMCCV